MRCLQLAKNGLGNTYPNPLVGCVIVHNNKVIGEGWHQKAGEAHAEVKAIHAVQNKTQLKKATLYVNLEPCNHFGKTPPCSDLILECGLPKVVVGSVDPHDKVAGSGIKKLKDHGCEVTVGVLQKECDDINKRFFTYHNKKRPFIILKWAETKDRFIDSVNHNIVENGGKKSTKAMPNWISNQYSRQLVHKWRAEEQAILVGTNTALNDNPKLDVRNWKGSNPIRVVIDRHLRIPLKLNLFDNKIRTIVITEKEGVSNRKNVIFETIDFNENVAMEICDVLYKNEIQSVIVEGGAMTFQTFIDAGLWDEARVFEGDTYFKEGLLAPIVNGRSCYSKKIKKDTLKVLGLLAC
jgi:diaminohydroxyphosphoribosylaminopyrimidine deaminase/5-amino-6-(5-phosphoribosylamino)uracil reductase